MLNVLPLEGGLLNDFVIIEHYRKRGGNKFLDSVERVLNNRLDHVQRVGASEHIETENHFKVYLVE